MILIIDYGLGNLNSVCNAFKKIGKGTVISSKKEDLEKASKIILPGVGHFKQGMKKLGDLDLINLLRKKVLEENVPILGICLGAQIFTEFSEEGNVRGLSLIEAETKKFDLGEKIKVPHMGWNTLKVEKESELLEGVCESASFYFVHSYYLALKNKEDILTVTDYGKKFVSSFQKDNIFGVQFHPEKSHEEGLKIMRNFANL